LISPTTFALLKNVITVSESLYLRFAHSISTQNFNADKGILNGKYEKKVF
jgi:hypothetical protein